MRKAVRVRRGALSLFMGNNGRYSVPDCSSRMHRLAVVMGGYFSGHMASACGHLQQSASRKKFVPKRRAHAKQADSAYRFSVYLRSMGVLQSRMEIRKSSILGVVGTN